MDKLLENLQKKSVFLRWHPSSPPPPPPPNQKKQFLKKLLYINQISLNKLLYASAF